MNVKNPEAILKALDTDDWLTALVKMAYGDLFGLPVRSLTFRTEPAHPLKILPAIRQVTMNRFNGEDVAGAIERLHEEGHLAAVEFGQEGTPVLYLTVPFFTNQKSNWIPADEARPLSEPEVNASREAVGQAMFEVRAVAVGFYDEEFRSNIRAWWD